MKAKPRRVPGDESVDPAAQKKTTVRRKLRARVTVPKPDPREIERALDEAVWQQRLGGQSARQIAGALGLTYERVRAAIDRTVALEAVAEECDSVREAALREVEHLDALTARTLARMERRSKIELSPAFLAILEEQGLEPGDILMSDGDYQKLAGTLVAISVQRAKILSLGGYAKVDPRAPGARSEEPPIRQQPVLPPPEQHATLILSASPLMSGRN